MSLIEEAPAHGHAQEDVRSAPARNARMGRQTRLKHTLTRRVRDLGP